MSRSRTEVYREAHAKWAAGQYGEAEHIMRALWEGSDGLRALHEMLFVAYVLRDEGKPVSELRLLLDLLESFQNDQNAVLLADAWSMAGAALRLLGESRLALDAFLQATDIEPNAAQKLVECSNAIFTANAIEGITSEEMQELYARYRALLAKREIAPLAPVRYAHDALRIGYLSADLRDHPVAAFVQSLFRGYDRTRFSIYAYSLAKREDVVTERLRAGGAIWRSMQGETHERIAAQIRADEIDVLVDLAGHTAGNALPVFAYRPAPVMISGIGYMGSTGLLETRGFLSDVHCAPDVQSPYFVEPLLRLPHSHFCYAPYSKFPTPGEPPCQSRGYVTFGCFNQFAKVTDAMLANWAQILAILPDAHLVLKHKLLGMEEGRDYARKRLMRLGLPLNRVELRGYTSDYLTEYHDIDIALDTSPYTGGLTTCEALYMGVPVVTLAGAYHGARFGASLLENVGLGELVAGDAGEYIALAVHLAHEWELLRLLRQSIRPQMERSPLMDGTGYVRTVEEIYEMLV